MPKLFNNNNNYDCSFIEKLFQAVSTNEQENDKLELNKNVQSNAITAVNTQLIKFDIRFKTQKSEKVEMQAGFEPRTLCL